MELSEYVNQIKFQLTGGILENELKDKDIEQIVGFALKELNRYYDSTCLITATASSCIDLIKLQEDNNIKMSSVSNVYRTSPVGSTSTSSGGTSDPMFIAQWNFANNYYGYNTNNFTLNYAAYNTMQQIGSTFSTDLDFHEDKSEGKLYINFSEAVPPTITIEYVPKLEDASDIKGEYWTDILLRLSLAHTKITLGRIRTRYTLSNAIWSQDGETLLTEGKEELAALRERLQAQANFTYPCD